MTTVSPFISLRYQMPLNGTSSAIGRSFNVCVCFWFGLVFLHIFLGFFLSSSSFWFSDVFRIALLAWLDGCLLLVWPMLVNCGGCAFIMIYRQNY